MDTTIRLPEELTIYTVGELRGTWLQQIDAARASPDAWKIDAAQVGEVDAAGVQLLLALFRAIDATGTTHVVEAPSAVLSRACTALGLDTLLHGGDA